MNNKYSTQAINHISENESTSTESSKPSTIINESETYNDDDKGLTIGNPDFTSSSNASGSSQNPSKIDSSKKIPIIFFQKFNPGNLLRPVQQKWKEIHDLLTYPFHPNYGGLILLSPQHIWSKLKEKGNFILGGAHNSIFGIAHPPPEYPFPYRQTGNKFV